MSKLWIGLLLLGSTLVASDQHWAWQPLERPEVPKNGEKHPIDALVRSQLPGKLKLAPEADRRTLIRRLTYDLTGLQPTPEAIETFLNDKSPNAYEDLIDRLLASEAYGEHMARHWLDLARFAETDGFEHDKVRPNAWRYRDWVIQAFNQDLPYNEFIKQQIAGDQFHPDNPQAAIATGFLLAGQDMPDIKLLDERKDMLLNEMTATVGTAFLGITMGCAQCHNHMFDPVSQKEFYQMRAFFESDLQLKEVKIGKLTARVMKTGKHKPTRLMIRGDFRRPGNVVKAGFPSVANHHKAMAQEGDRKELATWITRDDNALALRLAANRIWLQHFGKPIASPEDFGTMGEAPTQPILLDWLATELPHQNWSLKAMLKLLLTSKTWKQVSRKPESEEEASWKTRLALDPDNQHLSRQHRRRLTGEMLRDTMLFVSDSLSERKGGPGVRPPLPKEITSTLLRNHWPVSKEKEDHRRRSIYIFARRNLRYPLFDLFDSPALAESCARRPVSTTAPQSLALLNSQFVSDSAKRLAKHVLATNPSPEKAVKTSYLLTLGREPTSEELAAATLLVQNDESQELHLEDLCLALFNFNEFLYLD